MNKSIAVHMVVKNEDQFLWYSISSILPYVDKMIIYDTGSTDKTVSIIKLFKSPKIFFEEKGKVDSLSLVKLRQEQIDKSKEDWIWIVDGDEIYPQKTVESILEIINSKNNYKGIIVHRYDLIGDVYHAQEEKVGAYNQFGKVGHYVLRLINKASLGEIKVLGNYPNEYYANKADNPIKNCGKEHFTFVEESIFHAMYLKRSSLGGNLLTTLNRGKFKIELGREIPKKDIPKIFFVQKPKSIPDVTQERSLTYFLLALFFTPIKNLKRRIF